MIIMIPVPGPNIIINIIITNINIINIIIKSQQTDRSSWQ